MDWALLVASIVTLPVAVLNLVFAIRLWRQVRRLIVLNSVLAGLCIEACLRRERTPVWRAWAWGFHHQSLREWAVKDK